jgi:hypothetical protein
LVFFHGDLLSLCPNHTGSYAWRQPFTGLLKPQMNANKHI